MMKNVDARGLDCPQPVVLIRKAVAASPEGAEILVDNICAVENITRFAVNSGYDIEKKDESGDIRLMLTRK